MSHDEHNPLSPNYRGAPTKPDGTWDELADLIPMGIAWIVTGVLTIAVIYAIAFFVFRFVFGVELPNPLSLVEAR